MSQQTASHLIAGILNQNTPARSVPATLEQFNNSITKELNNSILTSDGTLVAEGFAETSSSLEEKQLGGLVSNISGVEIQMKPPGKETQSIYINIQTHEGFRSKEMLKYTGYLVARSHGRNFKRLTDFDRAMYDLSLDNKHWLIGHITERGTKQVFTDIVLTLDPVANQLVLWFSDCSGTIVVPTNNKELTDQQKQYFTSAGTWGIPMCLPNHANRSFLECRSRVGGIK